MPEYIVFVMPPSDEDTEPFDIPEWEFDAAMATAERYRERGWKACIIDYGTPFVPWRARATRHASAHAPSAAIAPASKGWTNYA